MGFKRNYLKLFFKGDKNPNLPFLRRQLAYTVKHSPDKAVKILQVNYCLFIIQLEDMKNHKGSIFYLKVVYFSI